MSGRGRLEKFRQRLGAHGGVWIERFQQMMSSAERLVFRRQLEKVRSLAWLYPGEQTLSNCLESTKAGVVSRSKRCLFIGAGLSVVLFLAGILRNPHEPFVDRPAAGEANIVSEWEVEARYDSHTFRRPMRILLKPKRPTEEEIRERIEASARRLDQIIAGENESLASVHADLLLPKYDEVNDVSIEWESSDPLRIDETGEVNVIGAPPGERVELTARLHVDGQERREIFVIRMGKAREVDVQRSLERVLKRLEKELGEEDENPVLTLPSSTEHAVQLRWKPMSPSYWGLPLLASLLGVTWLYFARYDLVHRQLLIRRGAVEEELPNLLLQLTLLLNAGLVITQAFDVILDQDGQERHALYEVLLSLRQRCRSSNESFLDAIAVVAKQSANRDFIRMASLISDHASKGSELAEKLEQERNHAWEGRLQHARGCAKEIETKLCLPLMMLLCALVVIAASPALIGM